MSNIVNDRDEILQAATSRLTQISADSISFLSSATGFTVNGSSVTPTSIILTFVMNGRLRGIPVITYSGVSSVVVDTLSATTTIVTVNYSNMTADTCSVTASLSFAGNTYTSTASISGSNQAPAQVADSITIIPENTRLRISWSRNTEIDIAGYEVRESDSGWGTDNLYIFRGNANSCSVAISSPTTSNTQKTYYIRAYDITNLYSSSSRSKTYTISAPTAPTGLSASYSSSSATQSSATLTWTNTVPTFGLKEYRVVVTLPDTTTKEWIVSSPNILLNTTWSGDASIVIYVKDLLGNESSSSTIYTLTKNAPGNVTLPSVPASPVGTKLLLDWNDVTKTSLPIVGYEVRTSNIGWGLDNAFIYKGTTSQTQVSVGPLNTAVYYYVKAYDSDNIYSSTATSFSYTRTPPPPVSAVTYEYSTSSTGQSTITFNWSRPTVETFAIDYYRVSLTKPGPVTITSDTYSNSWSVNADWEGSATLTVKVYDIFGEVSSTYTTTIYKVPLSVTNYTIVNPTPVNNTLLLSWTPSTQKSGIAWTRSATTATITDNGHGYATGNTINITTSSDTSAIPIGVYVITVLTPNSYTFSCFNAGTTSGTIVITNGSLQVSQYEIRASNNSTVLYKGSSTSYAVQGNNINIGSNTYYLYAIDSAGKYSSNSKSITYTYIALSGITGSASFTATGTARFQWTIPSSGSFGVKEYSLSLSGGSTASATRSTTDWEVPVPLTWTNTSAVLTITPKDVLDTIGTPYQITLTNQLLNTPGVPVPTLKGTDLELDWPDNTINTSTQLPVSRYEIRDGSNNTIWKGSQSKASISLLGLSPSNRTVSILVYDFNGYPCTTSRSYEYTSLITPSAIPIGSISYSFGTNITDSLLTITWAAQNPNFGLQYYKVSYIDSDSTITTTTSSTTLNISPIPKNTGNSTWKNNKSFNISVVDRLNSESTATILTINKLVPGSISNYTAQVIDNNVLLQWSLPSRTTLPIISVRIKKGSTWDTGTSIGDKTGTFTTIFERAAGNYTYWIAAVDSDGVEGPATSITATVAQPPDYIFNGQLFSKLTGGSINNLSTTDKGSGLALDSTSTIITSPSGASTWQTIRGTRSFISGKWYWEVTVLNNGNSSGGYWMAGVASSALLVNSQYVGQDSASWGYYNNSKSSINNTIQTAIPGAIFLVPGDILGLALDTIGGTLKMYRNGTLFYTQSGLTGTLYPAFSLYNDIESISVNFGTSAFKYQVPSEYNGISNAAKVDTSLILPVNTTATWDQHFQRNLFTYSDQLDNAVWTKTNTTITANSTTDPFSTSLADTITSSSTISNISQTVSSMVVGDTYTISRYVKSGNISFCTIGLQSQPDVYFDLVNLTYSSSSGTGFISATITDVGNSWRRISATYTKGSATNNIYFALASSLASQTVANGNFIYSFGHQVTPGPGLVPYISRSATTAWSSPNDQIIAGFPLYIQPSTESGSYEEVFDFGQVFSSTKVTVNLLGGTVSGSVNVVVNINISADGTSWLATPYTGTTIFGVNFRYVKVRITVYPLDSNIGIYKITSLDVSLDSKAINDAGSISVLSTDTDGTVANFSIPFIDIAGITLTPQTSSPVYSVADFKDAVLSATYSISSNICTVTTSVPHGFSSNALGQKVRLAFTSGISTDKTGVYSITSVPSTTTYTVALINSNTSGNVTTYSQGMRIYLYSSAGSRTSGTVSWAVRGY